MIKWLKNISKDIRCKKKLQVTYVEQNRFNGIVNQIKEEISDLSRAHSLLAWSEINKIHKEISLMSVHLKTKIKVGREEQEEINSSYEARMANIERQMAKLIEDSNRFCEEVRRALPKNMPHKKKGN